MATKRKSVTFEAKTALISGEPRIESRTARGDMTRQVFEAFGENCQLEIIFKRVTRRKTTAQLGYFHAVVLPEITQGMIEVGHDDVMLELVDQDGCLTGMYKRLPLSMRTVRAWLKTEHLAPRPIADAETGEEIGMAPPSLATLSTEEMGAFIEKCIRHAAEFLSITVTPSPSEQSWLHLSEK